MIWFQRWVIVSEKLGYQELTTDLSRINSIIYFKSHRTKMLKVNNKFNLNV